MGQHHYDGSKIAPPKRAAIIQSLAAGHGLLATAALTHSANQTVAAIRDANIVDLTITRRVLVNNLSTAAIAMSEKMAAEAHTIPVAQMAIPLAVTIDKLLLLTGEPTSIISHEVKRDVTLDDVRAYIESLPSAMPTDDAA